MSLSNVCYEQIKDQFWYGLLGDFKLIIDRNTGYFNATKLCQQGGKRFDNWLRNKESKELIEYYRRKFDASHLRESIIEVRKGSSQIYNQIISGTYLSDKLILSVASWISKDFYDKANEIVKSYYLCEFEEKYKNDIGELNEKLQRVDHIVQQLTSEKEKIEQENEKIRREKEICQRENELYQSFEEDIAPKTANVEKLNSLTVVKLNNESFQYSFYVIRTQIECCKKSIKKLKEKHPNLEIILELDYSPNSIRLFNRIKEQLRNIKFYYNYVKLLNGYTEEQFIRNIENLASFNVNLDENSIDVD
ncbi:unnamed protein product [Larinioides sclopetarius]|uniref:KilA-N domain-containing protein n=1 Tax=Larinioides sclopetarius TaxID=280406 RepID=A0AAV2C1S0_9ARAC